MRKVLFIGLTLLVLAGCKKFRGGQTTSAPAAISVTMSNTQNNGQPSVHAATGVVINPNQGGGSGGAAQAVRKAAVRVQVDNELKNIHLFIETASTETGKLPTIAQIKTALKKEDPKAFALVEDGTIQLTGANNRETIWAFTQFPQRGNNHMVVTTQGVEQMDTDTLVKRLNGQTGR